MLQDNGLSRGEERARRGAVSMVSGFIITTFRGDASLLTPTRRDVRHRTRKPRDLLVLLGNKDTLADLRFLEQRGFAAAIRAHAEGGGALRPVTVTRRVRARWLPHRPDFDGDAIGAG